MERFQKKVHILNSLTMFAMHSFFRNNIKKINIVFKFFSVLKTFVKYQKVYPKVREHLYLFSVVVYYRRRKLRILQQSTHVILYQLDSMYIFSFNIGLYYMERVFLQYNKSCVIVLLGIELSHFIFHGVCSITIDIIGSVAWMNGMK